MNTEEKLNQYVLHSYGRYPMAAVRGEGSRLWDSTGKCYLDFCAGIATCVLGHCHPAVTQALQKQAATLVQQAVHPDALTIFGATFDESMDDEIRVTVIATGFADGKSAAAAAPAAEKKAAEAKPGIEPINYEEDKAAAEAEKKTEEEDDPFADIFKIFNRER